MKKSLKFFSIAALVLAGALSFGCDSISEEEIVPQPIEQFVTLTTTVSIEKPATKAVGADGAKTFEVDDQMTVFINGTKYISEKLTANDIDGKKAKFTVKNVSNPEAGQSVIYIYPASAANDDGTVNYTVLATQNGLQPSQSNPVDFCQFTGNLTADAKLPTTATLSNPLTLVKFTIENEDGSSDITSTITRLTVTNGTNTYTVNREAAEGPIWVAMLPVTSGKISMTALAGMDYYSKEVSGKALAASELYPVTVKMVFDPVKTPLTFEAGNDGATISFTPGADLSPNLKYLKNNGTWTAWDYSLITLNPGDKISFCGDNSALSQSGNTSSFSCSSSCYIYGNIMSLLNENNYATTTSLSGEYAFSKLFYNNANIYNHPDDKKVIKLPATTLTMGCYQQMFAYCTKLTVAPDLPAEELASYCYSSMFQSSGLTTAPALPAHVLQLYCYQSMFNGCTSLTTPPTMPSENVTLANYCCSSMFSGCTNLASAPVLAATEIKTYSYYYMFYNCGGLIEAPELPATTVGFGGYSAMFEQCYHLKKAPELPATSVADYGYQNMFKKCTDLQSVPKFSAVTIGKHGCNSMFDGCSDLTSFPSILPAETLSEYCYCYMFANCTSLTTAPILPALTLVEGCYYQMFYHNKTNTYSKLSSVTCLATDISATDCTKEWLHRVSQTGTFTAPDGTAWTSDSESGIPTDWTRVSTTPSNN